MIAPSARPSMWVATWSRGSAVVSRSATRRSRSRAVTRAVRYITAPESTTTRTTMCLSSAQQRVLPLKDPPRHRDSRRVRRVHAAIAEAARPEGSGLRVWGVGGVVDDAQVEVEAGHADALTERITGRPGGLVGGRGV